MSSSPLRRVGLLSAIEASGGDEAALIVGDVAARHVRLTTAGIQSRLGDAPSGFVPWAEVRSIRMDPPTTSWLHPAVVDVVGPILEGVLGGGVAHEIEETPTFAVRVETVRIETVRGGAARGEAAGIQTAGGDTYEWRATPHHLSGYRRQDLAAGRVLVDQLVAQRDLRALLARPDVLLDRLAQMRRGSRRSG